MTNYIPKKGDHVRVVMEGEGDQINTALAVFSMGGYVKSVEKIQEPLKIGDYCLFWDDEKADGIVGTLKAIDSFDTSGLVYGSVGYHWYKHAERVPKEFADYLKTVVG